MKKIVLIVLLVFFNYSFGQKQTLFLDKNYEAVLKQSKAENKPIVLMFYATWCVHCNKMKNEIFIDDDVINFYKNNFICTAIDAESPEGIALKNKLQNKFKVKAYPTFGFLDGNENLLNCISGEFKKDEFITEAKNTLLPENQFNTIKEAFDADSGNPDKCLKYITAQRKAGFDATSTTQKYLKTLNQKELFSELNWRIMANGINDIEAKEIAFIRDNKEAFVKVSSPTRVDKKLTFIASDNLKIPAEQGDTLNYLKKRPIAESFKIRKVDSLLFRFDLVVYEKTSNWKKYQKTCETNIEKFAFKDSNTLIEIASNYLSNVADKKGLDNAVNWVKQAISLSESLEKYILISKLYEKEKEYTNALEYAQKGKEVATHFGWKTDEIDALINNLSKHKKS